MGYIDKCFAYAVGYFFSVWIMVHNELTEALNCRSDRVCGHTFC
jgi:hypothetical protein